MFKIRARIGIAILGCCFVMGCTKKVPDSPSAVVEEYIHTAMSAKGPADKTKLMELTTGSAHDDLQKMTDEQFNEQFVKTQLKFEGVKTKDLREENSGDVSLVYELNYKENAYPTADFSNKKIAYLSRDTEGHWKIRETKNIKSFIDKKTDMEVLGGPETPKNENPPAQH